jgi:hypothetical protein
MGVGLGVREAEALMLMLTHRLGVLEGLGTFGLREESLKEGGSDLLSYGMGAAHWGLAGFLVLMARSVRKPGFTSEM